MIIGMSADVVMLIFIASAAEITEVDVSCHAVIVMPVDKRSDILWSVQPLQVMPASHNFTRDSQPRALAFALPQLLCCIPKMVSACCHDRPISQAQRTKV